MDEVVKYIDIENFKRVREELNVKNSDSYSMTTVFSTLVDMWIDNIKKRMYSDSNPFLMASIKEMYRLPRYVIIVKNNKVEIVSESMNISDDSSFEYYITRRLCLKGDVESQKLVINDFEEFSKGLDIKKLFINTQHKFSRVDIPFRMYRYVDSSIKDMICEHDE